MPRTTQHPSDRRKFLTTLATGSAALAAGGVALHLTAADAFAATRAPDASEPADDEWLEKITGKHRQFFDATAVNGGFGLVFAMNFLNSNNDHYKLADKNLSAVVGLRHFSIPMAFTDDIWKRYKLGEFAQTMDPATKKPSERNIFYHPKDGDMSFPGAAIDKLMARGVIFTVCNVALTVLSGMMSKNAGVTADVAKKEWTAGLIPGVNIVASGVLAVNRAQEMHCTYCSGS